MPLQPQVFDVPIRPANQDAPSTAAPVGRVKALVNKVAVKVEGGPADPNAAPDSGTRITIEPRAGMQSLTPNVRNVTSGASISTTSGVQDAKLVASLGNELVAVADSAPHVLSESSPAWSKYPYVYSPVTARTKPVVAGNVQVSAPDGATLNGRILRAWSQPETVNSAIAGVLAMMIDVDGTVVRAPWSIATGTFSQRAKVVSDGTRFWLVCSSGISVLIHCYDTHGVLVGSTTLAGILATDASPWDLTFCEGYVLFVHAPAFNAEVRRFSISGSTITSTTFNLGNVARADHGVAWAENASADGNAYLLTAHQYVTIVEYAFRIGNLATTPTVTGYFSVAQTSGAGIIYDEDGEGGTSGGIGLNPAQGILFEMTGVFRDGVLYAQLSFCEYPGDVAGDVRDARIVPIVATVGALATVQATVRSVHAASRVFRHDGRDVLLVYYPAATTVVIGTYPDQIAYAGDPTYFMLDVLTRQVCGRFNMGTASMEWTRKGWPETFTLIDGVKGPFLFHIPHVFIDTASITHVPCTFASRQFVDTSVVTVTARSGAAAFTPTTITKSAFTSAIGYQDIELGGTGHAIEFGGELLLPGAIATAFDGATFVEQGFSVPPQQPTAVQSSGGSIENGRREYVLVFQDIDRNGDRVLSAPSTPIVITTTGSNGTVTLTGRSLRMTTRQNVTTAVYRNIITAGVPSTVHYRVDDPLQPLANKPDGTPWTFVDTLSDASISSRERLYTDDDLRPRDPMPSFSTGDIFDGRVVCDAPDGSIWFSAQKVEGDATWFTASQRIPAVTNEPIKNLVTMDRRLVEIYDRHIWTQDATGMPGPTNSSVGAIQAAERTTFTNGGTGFARLVNEGVMYSSSEGGVWLVTRGLVNQRVTGPVVDDIAGHVVTGIIVDAQQRIHIGCTSLSVVFDQLSGVWSRFEHPVHPTVMHSLRGRILYASSYGVYVEDPAYFTDVDTSGNQRYIVGAVEFKPFHFQGVKRYSRLWRFNCQGETLGNHTVTLVATYDPETAETPLTETWTWAVETGDVWAFEFQPKLEQIEALSLSFVESFPAGPTYTGKSFRLEMLGFEVGLESGLARVPLAKRIQST